ncbi:MAG: VOC family protein [Actinomycetota bacterium]
MSSAFDLCTFDTPSPDSAASFWCAALGLHVTEREDDGRWIVLSDELRVRRIALQRGAVRGGSVHLDVVCTIDEFQAEVARLVLLGAQLRCPTRTEEYGRIANLADPDGNPFDLCAYG